MNRMKALYPIKLPKSSGDASEVARASEQVNEEHLNDNFRTIASELVKLWEGGEQQLNVMSSRITSSQEGLAALNQSVNTVWGILQIDTQTNTSVIQQLSDSIGTAVSESHAGYVWLKEYVDGTATDENDDPVYPALYTAQQTNINSISQTATATENRLTSTINVLNNNDNPNAFPFQTTVKEISSWVRILGPSNTAGVPAGVIIGESEATASLKAEATDIFFYKGDDTSAWWKRNGQLNPNALAGFDADGHFVANAVHTESTLLDGKFDIDVVTANSVDFLHITGRN